MGSYCLMVTQVVLWNRSSLPGIRLPHTHVLPHTGCSVLGQLVSLTRTFPVEKMKTSEILTSLHSLFLWFPLRSEHQKITNYTMKTYGTAFGTARWNGWAKVFKTLFSKLYTKVIFKYFEGMMKAGQPTFKEITCMEGTLYGLRITTDSGSLPALAVWLLRGWKHAGL